MTHKMRFCPYCGQSWQRSEICFSCNADLRGYLGVADSSAPLSFSADVPMPAASHTSVSPIDLRNLKDIFRVKEYPDGYHIYDGLSEDIDVYEIPDFVISIGANAFSEFDSLEHLIIPKSVRSIDENAFQDCYSLSTLTITLSQELMNNISTLPKCLNDVLNGSPDEIEYTFDENATVIPKGVFNEMDITELDLTQTNIEVIGDGAFDSCTSLENVYLGNSVREISPTAFNSCYSITEVHLSSECPLSIRELKDIFEDCEITRD